VPSNRKLAAFAKLGGDVDGLVERTMYSMEGGHTAATRLLRRDVTAVICSSDVLALGTIRAARRAGLRVPEDLSVVGYDDSALMTCTDPPLTTVRQPIDPMGQTAVALLVSQLSGEPVATDEMLFEPELVVRGSTGPAALHVAAALSAAAPADIA
jgi:DNA-binding LacI/PurR family transcriptional regulator